MRARSGAASRPIPVVFLSPAKAGGAERVLASLVRHLPGYGFEPAVLLLEPGPLERWLEEAGCRRVVAAEPGASVRDLARALIREQRAEIVVSSKWHAHVHGGAAAVAEGKSAIWWQHDIAKLTPREQEAASLPAAAIVCTGAFAADAQRRLTPAANIVEIHPGVPVGEIAGFAGGGAAIRRSLGWESSPIVGIVGRIERWKGQHVFLQAAAIVAEQRPEVRFAIVGGVTAEEGLYPDRLQDLAAELGLAKRVHFAGHQERVWPWFDALDVAAHATDGEPFGLVLVEAMALGTPVVATAVGGPTEIVEDGVSGLLVPPGRPDAMAAAIERILDEPGLSERLARAGRQRAERFTEERMVERFAELMRGLV